MTERAPRSYRVPVDGGPLSVLRFGDGRATVVAAHGITGSGMSFRAVARHLPPGWQLLAADLRGRGHSADLPGPYGFASHVRDLCAVAEHAVAEHAVAEHAVAEHAVAEHTAAGHAEAGKVVLTGHSMGAYVALLAAASRPELFERLVLIDGGLPMVVPEQADLDQVLDATLGPAIARLSMTFPSEEAYLDFFRAHPALGPHWNDDIAAYVSYDLTTGGAAAMRSRVREEAVRIDGRELLSERAAFGAALRSLTIPVLLLVAPDGMFGQPPGFVPEPVVLHWRRQAPKLCVELVPDCNHYTLLLGRAPAALVAQRLTDASSWPVPQTRPA